MSMYNASSNVPVGAVQSALQTFVICYPVGFAELSLCMEKVWNEGLLGSNFFFLKSLQWVHNFSRDGYA